MLFIIVVFVVAVMVVSFHFRFDLLFPFWRGAEVIRTEIVMNIHTGIEIASIFKKKKKVTTEATTTTTKTPFVREIKARVNPHLKTKKLFRLAGTNDENEHRTQEKQKKEIMKYRR